MYNNYYINTTDPTYPLMCGKRSSENVIPVGKFFNITAKSATGWPSNIVPFLKDPTARTSSTPCKQKLHK